MSYTVGLDFGTHQTKVCIEDASNPAQKNYEFVEFSDLSGKPTVLFPSIVQINQDNTVSYGFINEKLCKTASADIPEPVLALPEKPLLLLPEKPKLLPDPLKPKKPDLKGHSIKDQFKLNKQHEIENENWKNKCEEIKISNTKVIEEWNDDCQAITNDYNYDCDEYQTACDIAKEKYNQAHTTWQNDNIPQKQIFRYFKLATFTNQNWSHTIKPEIISCWYLAFVLFTIREKIGSDFFTQMGVPYSILKNESDKQKQIAYKLLIGANKLVDYYDKFELFLEANVEELFNNTMLNEFNEDDLYFYGLNVLPEAFAGLSSITLQGKLSQGMHLLTDIGGGTTDIAFFTITSDKLPDVHAVLSIPKGLNYIFEEHMKTANNQFMEKIQSVFFENQSGFEMPIKTYHIELTKKASDLIIQIEKEFCSRKINHGIAFSRLREALNNRPIVYCGGGAIYDSMRIPLDSFTDVTLINKNLLNIPHLRNKIIDNTIYPILATSFGLSIPTESEMVMTKIEDVFARLPGKESNRISISERDYNLSDD